MGWKDLFRPKGVALKADARIRWFGKLPTYADYYTSSGDEDWSVEFHEWLLKGYETYHSRKPAGERSARLPGSTLIVRLPKSRMTVLAALQDYGGDMRGRPFPLCFYVGLPSDAWPGPAPERIGPALDVLERLTTLRQEVARFCNAPGRFEVRFGGRELTLGELLREDGDTRWLQAARALPLADWFAAARPALKVDELGRWHQLAHGWGDAIAGFESDDFSPTLRFPLAARVAPDVQIAGWLRWLSGRMDVAGRWLTVITTQAVANDVGYLYVVARELTADDFLLLTSLATSLPYVDDLCALGGNERAEDKPGGPTSGRTSQSVPQVWAEFVEAVPSP